MAKLIEYDVTDVEESSGGTGVKARPAVYVAKIMKCKHRTEKRDGTPANDLEVALNVGDEYDWVFTYIGLDKASDWKMKEFVKAVGLKDKGKLDPDKMVDKIIRVKLNSGEYNGEYRPEAGRLMAPMKGDEFGSTVAASAGTAANPEAAEDVAEAAEADDGFIASREVDADGNIDEEVGSYDDWEDGDLEAEVSDRGLTLPGGRGKKRDKCIAALRSDDEAFYDSETAVAEGEGEAEEPSDDEDDYDSWEIADLVKEYEERGFDDPVPTFRGRNADGRQKTAVIEALRADDNADPFEA